MNKKIFLSVILAMVLVFGMAVVGCDDSSTDDGGSQNLPTASGVNVVSGKTYFEYSTKIVFSATANGAANGTYTKGSVERDDDGNYVLDNNDKYKYVDIETGTYTWNETAKTVTLKPEKITAGSESDGYGALENETAYRKSLQTMLDNYKVEMGEFWFNQQLSSMGFSSIAAYLNYAVGEAFSNKTNGYSFSTDGTALFLEKVLPANKGTNQFSGQTYYGMIRQGDGDDEGKRVKDETQKYVFTASGYTFTDTRYWSSPYTETGAYAYDSNTVWLKPEKINGKDRQEMYAEVIAWSDHGYTDDNACRAARTNGQFSYWAEQYNSINKTIGWEN